MKNKALVLAAFVLSFSVLGYAGTRNWFQVPVNQTGAADSYSLPCVKYNMGSGTAGQATTPVLALDEVGMVYWVAVTPTTDGDYVVFRDSGTANTTSAEFLRVKGDDITGTRYVQFDPPILVTNGLSVNVSSQTSHATVCVREADGDL